MVEPDADGSVTRASTAWALTVKEALLAVLWREGLRAFAADRGEVQGDDPDDPMRRAMRQTAYAFAELGGSLVVKRMLYGRRAGSPRAA